MTQEVTTYSKWANRFIWAGVAQGLFAVIWTLLIIAPFVTPSISKIIAAGSVGTWFFVGYISYIVVGVLGVAITSLFYQYLEVTLRKTYRGLTNILAWLHFLLMNVGVVGATWLLMYAGYVGGVGLMPVSSGGFGLNAGQVHPMINGLVQPIGFFIIVLSMGVMLGGLGYILVNRSKSK